MMEHVEYDTCGRTLSAGCQLQASSRVVVVVVNNDDDDQSPSPASNSNSFVPHLLHHRHQPTKRRSSNHFCCHHKRHQERRQHLHVVARPSSSDRRPSSTHHRPSSSSEPSPPPPTPSPPHHHHLPSRDLESSQHPAHHHHHHHLLSSGFVSFPFFASSSGSQHQRLPSAATSCISNRNCCFLTVVYCLLLITSAVMSSPVRPTASSSPKWINPCNYDLDSRSSSSSSENVDFQSAEARDMYEQIVHEVGQNEAYVRELKLKFVEDTFGDPSFTEEFRWISYNWLPEIPSSTPENFSTPEVSLKKSFEYLQHFAVAVEQMTMDQMIYEGSHLDQFRTVEKKLRNVLCLLQGAMLKLHVEANPDVTRGVMSEDYRSIESDAMRNVRDYIILRDHAHALDYIHKAFSHFQNMQEDSG